MAKVSRRLWLRRKRRRLMFLGLRGLVRVLGFGGAGALGSVLGELQFRIARSTRERCTQGMAAVLGRAADDPLLHAQLREAYRRNTAAVLEVMAMFDRPLDAPQLAARCAVEGLDHLHAALAGGRGAILLATHSGNAALLALHLASTGIPVSVVFRQSRMMSADFFAQGLARYGVDGILANEGLKAYGRMLGALRRGSVVFLMMDQGVKQASDGLPTRFLGKDLPLSAGPAQLARHARAPLLPAITIAAEPQWRFRLEASVERTAGTTLEQDFEQLVRLTERQILLAPQLWSWQQRRWRLFPLAATHAVNGAQQNAGNPASTPSR